MVSSKLFTDTLSIFQTCKIRKHECMGMLLCMIIKETVHLTLSIYNNEKSSNQQLTELYVHKKQVVTITLSQTRYQHFGLPDKSTSRIKLSRLGLIEY